MNMCWFHSQKCLTTTMKSFEKWNKAEPLSFQNAPQAPWEVCGAEVLTPLGR